LPPSNQLSLGSGSDSEGDGGDSGSGVNRRPNPKQTEVQDADVMVCVVPEGYEIAEECPDLKDLPGMAVLSKWGGEQGGWLRCEVLTHYWRRNNAGMNFNVQYDDDQDKRPQRLMADTYRHDDDAPPGSWVVMGGL
jgi:hypothetical protein